MKLLSTFITVLFFSAPLFAQHIETEKPDYKKIEKEISKKESNLYYPKLWKRYANGDTTMTLMEKRHLYYGYSFQDSYSPYGISDYSDSLKKVLHIDELSKNDLHRIVEFSDSILNKNPFDLRTMNDQLYAYRELGMQSNFNREITQLRIIIDAILSSGDGLTKETAFYVINAANEYTVIIVLDLKFGGEQSLIDHYDYLKVAENDQGIDGLFFDISPCLKALKKLFK